MKLLAHGPRVYLKDGWNYLDVIVVAVSLAGIFKLHEWYHFLHRIIHGCMFSLEFLTSIYEIAVVKIRMIALHALCSKFQSHNLDDS